MSYAKLFLAALAGFVLGAMLFHTPRLKAQGLGGGGVWVKQATTGGYNIVQGTQVVGFSCTDSDCYIATR